MRRDDGIVFDDGTTSRLSENHYFMTTTTANAGPVMAHMEMLLQTAWPELRVHLTSVSDQWAGIAVAGPKSRELLSALGVGNALRVLGALMSEQRVVFIGDKWGRVSACAHAALSMLYPLRWQHICIPVLPTSKLSYASAPMPFVLGVLSRPLPLLEKEPLEGILFADLESGRLWGDADVMAAATLPKPHVEPFASALKKVMRKAKESGGPVDDFAVGEAALRFMASLLGHYRQHGRGDDATPPAVGRGCDMPPCGWPRAHPWSGGAIPSHVCKAVTGPSALM